jgi:flagellar motility protein MotE (MotC chaperone)
MARTFAETMGSDAFSSMLGKSLEQSLTMQQRFSKEMKPQLDDALQAFNLPSRSQMDRLFERVIGLEERLDDLEENTRKIIKTLSDIKEGSTSRQKQRTPPASKKDGS